jgi:Uri superfamily endonuclease
MSEHATGVYLLFISARGLARVGRLGEKRFDGTYVYVGSARGPGGIKRLHRHYQVARGGRSGGRWHIDRLLALGQLEAALFIHTQEPVECHLAQRVSRVAALAVPGFGSTDCRCPGHLFRLDGGREGVVGAAAGLGSYRWVTAPARLPKGRPPGNGGP